MEGKKRPGTLIGFDLTVHDAEKISHFYHEVVGWEIGVQNMGGYEDYFMKDGETGEVMAGVCHAKGVNKDLPPVWLMYLQVEDLDESLARCEKLGGKVIGEKRSCGAMCEFVLIQDPAGAYVMLWHDKLDEK